VPGNKWTSEEDAKLNSAVTNNRKKKSGKGCRTDWAAVVALVPSRTRSQCRDRRSQCRDRWLYVLDPSTNQLNRRTGNTWAESEDIKLMNASQTHGGKKWSAITALVTVVKSGCFRVNAATIVTTYESVTCFIVTAYASRLMLNTALIPLYTVTPESERKDTEAKRYRYVRKYIARRHYGHHIVLDYTEIRTPKTPQVFRSSLHTI
jgi:hypothetical protein